MRKSIHLPKTAVISVLLFFTSVLLIINNATALYRYHHPYDLTELQPSMLDAGKYVDCSVDTYLIKYFVAEGIGSGYSSQMGAYLSFSKTYYAYTIPFSEDDYIRIAIEAPEKVNQLEAFDMGKGEPVTFRAKIRKDHIWSGNTDWYDGVENLDKSRVVENYILWEETDFSLKNGLYFGIYLLLFSVFLYHRSGGIRFIMEETEPDFKKLYANTFNKFNELEILEGRLPKYEKKMQSLKRWAIFGLCCLLFGILGFSRAVKTYNEVLLYLSIFCICYGPKEVWTYFINTDCKTAVKVADFFRINTLYQKRELTKKKMEYLQDLLQKDFHGKEGVNL